MSMYYNSDPSVNRIPTPSWIIFKTGKHQARIPFADTTPSLAWRNVLEITTLGFNAHRIGDAIVITGKPSNRAVEVWS